STNQPSPWGMSPTSVCFNSASGTVMALPSLRGPRRRLAWLLWAREALARRHEPDAAGLPDHRARPRRDRRAAALPDARRALPDRADRVPARDRRLHLPRLARAAWRDRGMAGTRPRRVLRRCAAHRR